MTHQLDSIRILGLSLRVIVLGLLAQKPLRRLIVLYLERHTGIRTLLHTRTHRGIHLGIHTGIHTGTDTDMHTGMQQGIHTGTDTSIHKGIHTRT